MVYSPQPFSLFEQDIHGTSMTKKYSPSAIEPKWQQFWDANSTFSVSNDDFTKPKYYVLDMFPYPSGSGLHVGHPEGYTATDILARYRRAQGFNVLHPMGWDAFGLPAEQYAIKTGQHPAITTVANIATDLRLALIRSLIEKLDQPLLARLSIVPAYLTLAYLVIRIADVAWRFRDPLVTARHAAMGLQDFADRAGGPAAAGQLGVQRGKTAGDAGAGAGAQAGRTPQPRVGQQRLGGRGGLLKRGEKTGQRR